MSPPKKNEGQYSRVSAVPSPTTISKMTIGMASTMPSMKCATSLCHILAGGHNGLAMVSEGVCGVSASVMLVLQRGHTSSLSDKSEPQDLQFLVTIISMCCFAIFYAY